VTNDEIVLGGLTVPHSPRWFNGELWLLETGSGHICRADLTTGRLERIAFCPGYLRGFTVVGRYAVVGLSKARRARAFADLPLDVSLAKHGMEERCGIAIVDLEQGTLVHWLWLSGFVHEIYDVIALPGVTRPMALGFQNDQIQLVLTIEGLPSPIQGPLRVGPGEGPP